MSDLRRVVIPRGSVPPLRQASRQEIFDVMTVLRDVFGDLPSVN